MMTPQQGQVPPQQAPAPAPEQGKPFEHTPQGQQLVDQGIDLMYGKHLDATMKHLKGKDEAQLPALMSGLVNTVLKKLEQDAGQPFSLELAAEVGFSLIVMLMSDAIQDKVIPDISKKAKMATIADLINDYALTHKDTVSSQQMKEFLSSLSSGQVNMQIAEEAQVQGQPPQGQPPQGQPPMPQDQMQQQGLLGG